MSKEHKTNTVRGYKCNSEFAENAFLPGRLIIGYNAKNADSTKPSEKFGNCSIFKSQNWDICQKEEHGNIVKKSPKINNISKYSLPNC